MGKPIKIISWNVNGIRASVKKGFYEVIKDLDPDIMCIQETKAQDDIMQDIAREMGGYELYVNSAVKKGYSGTAVLTRLKPKGYIMISVTRNTIRKAGSLPLNMILFT